MKHLANSIELRIPEIKLGIESCKGKSKKKSLAMHVGSHRFLFSVYDVAKKINGISGLCSSILLTGLQNFFSKSFTNDSKNILL
jgi:hypothetical protein